MDNKCEHPWNGQEMVAMVTSVPHTSPAPLLIIGNFTQNGKSTFSTPVYNKKQVVCTSFFEAPCMFQNISIYAAICSIR